MARPSSPPPSPRAVPRRPSFLVVVLAALLPGVATAGAVDQLREFASSTRSARGEFVQQQQRTGGRAAETASGTFAFSRPGRFRWEVARPYEQVVVTDGDRLYFYDKDLRQVTVRKVGDAVSATPAAILFGANDVESRFALKELGASDGLEWLEAVPRTKESGFDAIRIGLRNGLPEAMEVRDAFGQVTRFAFRAIERNPTLEPGLFRFTAPKGVDVVQ